MKRTLTELIEKLACPTCKDPLKKGIEGYECSSCEAVYKADESILDLLPIRKTDDLRSDKLDRLVEAAKANSIRTADKVIQSIVGCLRTQRDLAKLVPGTVAFLDMFYRQYSDELDEGQRTTFLSFITLARYELETAAGSYIGGFVLPDKMSEQLPAGDYLEIAMGPGDNLRKIAVTDKPYSITGCDISKGMVQRAEDINGRSMFFRADAQYLPLKDGQYDVVMMLNCLDRVPNTRQALTEASRVLRGGGTLIVGNCIPLQNEKEVSGGVIITYVPPQNRVYSMEEAVKISECSIQGIEKEIPWYIKTIEDGDELLKVDVAIGRKQ